MLRGVERVFLAACGIVLTAIVVDKTREAIGAATGMGRHHRRMDGFRENYEEELGTHLAIIASTYEKDSKR